MDISLKVKAEKSSINNLRAARKGDNDASKGEYQLEFPKLDKTKTYKIVAEKNPEIQLFEENILTLSLK
ncbi:MAG: hypothetical protein H7Y18_11830 [Clostridiaceae bacterium]|nr:hypothetical protein [Clostridiaceae bacterium]